MPKSISAPNYLLHRDLSCVHFVNHCWTDSKILISNLHTSNNILHGNKHNAAIEKLYTKPNFMYCFPQDAISTIMKSTGLLIKNSYNKQDC